MYIPDYQRRRTTRQDKPSNRVRAAINRLSRDRPLWPEEVRELTWAFARRATWTPQGEAHVVKAVLGMHDQVPWFRGSPVSFPFEPGYTEVRKAVRNADRRKPHSLEITLLRLSAGRSAMSRVTELENHL